jgi:hypothetical protein
MKTNREKFFARYGVDPKDSLSLEEIARLSKMPIAALKEVKSRGAGAFFTNPESVRKSVSSAEQWSFGRVYSFVMKQPSTFRGSDKDIAEKYNLT